MIVPVTLWLLVFLGSLLVVFYVYSRHAFKYFKKRGVPHEPGAFLFGSLWPIFVRKQSYNELLYDIYRKHKGEKFVGFFQFHQKSVLIRDTELIRRVLVKDYDCFEGKGIHYNRKLEPLTAHLFALEGEEWKHLRMKMTPTFSSGKLKNMFGTVLDVAEQMNHYMVARVKEDDLMECKNLFSRYGLAIISSCAFGLESDVFTDEFSTFLRVAQTIQPPTIDGLYRNALWFYGKDIALRFGLRIIRKDTHDFYMNLVRETLAYREAHGESRNDFLQLLLQLRQGTKVSNKDYILTTDEIAAQAYVFIIAGFETSSITMSFCLYELALNPEMQRRVLAEVDGVDDLTYDNLTNMEYLEMVIDETLRKYSPLGFVGRVCTRDYQVPGTNQVIEKGTNVMVSMHGLHRDPELFPEPELFNPERFSKENKDNIKPFSYMPFGEGPRFCIGMRFGRLVVKAGLAKLLRQFEVRKTPRTPETLHFDPRTISTIPKEKVWLKFLRREKA